MAGFTQTSLSTLIVATQLATLGTSMNIIRELTGFTEDHFKRFCKPPKYTHKRNAGYIYKGCGEKYVADRLYRILHTLYGKELYKCFTAADLLDVYTTYIAIHPNDVISTNRIFYTWKFIISRTFSVKKCDTCDLPMLTHTVQLRDCGECLNITRIKQEALTKQLQRKSSC